MTTNRKSTAKPPPGALLADVVLYRIVVGALALIALASVVGAVLIATATTRDTPQVLVAFGSAAIGALASLLVKASGAQDRH